MIAELLSQVREDAEQAQSCARLGLEERDPERRRLLLTRAEDHARAAARSAWKAAEVLRGAQ